LGEIKILHPPKSSISPTLVSESGDLLLWTCLVQVVRAEQNCKKYSD